MKSPLLLAVATFAAAASAVAQTPTLETLFSFNGTTDGAKGLNPRGHLLLVGSDLLGVTEFGGTAGTASGTTTGYGTIFKASITSPGTLTTFAPEFSGTNGFKPRGGLLAFGGKYYGTTFEGGTDNKGTVFVIDAAGAVSTLYSFRTATEGTVGAKPTGALVELDGFLYGTTSIGGRNGGGTLYRMTDTGGLTLLHEFDGEGSNGKFPSPLIKDTAGNLYGTAEDGGIYSGSAGGGGIVFKYRPAGSGTFTTLVSFGTLLNNSVGQPKTPKAGLLLSKLGLLYGTTSDGGTDRHGTVFSVTTAGTGLKFISLTGNTGVAKGKSPEAALMQATNDVIYGTTRLGGSASRGTLFSVTTALTAFTTLVEFRGTTTPTPGSYPLGTLVQDNERNLYGTTSTGGDNDAGMIFKLANALPPKPTVTTGAQLANSITGTKAGIIGKVVPQTTAATCWFEYGLTDSYGQRINANPIAVAANKPETSVTALLTGLSPNKIYHYRFVAQNGGGTTWGGDETFRTNPHPEITDEPDDLIAAKGSTAAFTVIATGNNTTSPLTYAWLKNAVTRVAVTPGLTLPNVQLVSGGSYSVVVTKGVDANTSKAARLAVIDTAGSNTVVNEAKPLVLKLLHGSPAGSLSFQWTKDDTPLTNGTRIIGATSDTLTVASAIATDAGAYKCTVTLGSLTAEGGTHNVTVRLLPVVAATSLGPWITNGQAFGNVSAAGEGPMTYSSPNLPPGVKLNATTGALTGRPLDQGTYFVRFTAKNLAGEGPYREIAIVVEEPTPESAGRYVGNIVRGTSNGDLGGFVDITLTSIGTLSGRVIHSGKSYASIIASLSPAPEPTRMITGTAAGVPPLPLTLNLDTVTGDITGTVNGATVTMKRVVPSISVPLGRFNVATTPTTTGDPAIPQGSGHGAIVLAAAGAITWAGTLADGTVTSHSTGLAVDGTFPMHLPLYAATGSAQGVWVLPLSEELVGQSFDWVKKAQLPAVVTRSYKSGFALHTLDVVGGRWVKPGVGVNALGLTGTTGNAQAVFTDGSSAAVASQLLNWPATNVAVTNGVSTTTPVTFATEMVTGTFSGAITLKDPVPANVRSAKYFGVLIPRLGQGFGQWQLNDLLPTPTTSPIRAARVVVKAATP